MCKNRNTSVASMVSKEDSDMRDSMKSDGQIGIRSCRALVGPGEVYLSMMGSHWRVLSRGR